MQRLPGIQKARKALILVAFGAALVLMCSQVQAGDIIWTNMNGGYFTNALNWNPQTVPTGTNETAVFTNDIRAAPYTVYFNQPPVSNKAYTVTGGKVIFDLGGGTNYFYGPGTGTEVGYVGSLGVAELTISNGWMATIVQPWFALSTAGTIFRVCNGGRVIGASYCGVGVGTSLIVDGSNSLYDTSAGGGYEAIAGNITATNGGIARFLSLNPYGLGANVNLRVEIGSNSLVTMPDFTPGYCSGSYASQTGNVHVCGGGVFKTSGAITIPTNINVTVTLDAGGVFSTDSSTTKILNYGGVFQGSGLITGAFYNATAMGYVRPGGTNQAGTLTFSGAYKNGDTNTGVRLPGTLEIELGGTAANQYDRTVVSGTPGTLTATGTLTVSLINGFQPRGRDRFKILDFNAITGTFNTVILPGDATHWDLRNLYITGEIQYLIPGAIVSVF